jgi:hypothetical protein
LGAGARNWKAAFDKALAAKILKIAALCEARVKEKIVQLGLVDTGRFLNSVSADVNGDTITIRDGVEYGKYLEYGTTAHFVKPKTKKALHWKEKGGDAFSKGHVVSGIKVFAPFRRALISAVPDIIRIMTE